MMPGLSSIPLLSQIVQIWNKKLHEEIPNLEQPTMVAIDGIWTAYTTEVRNVLQNCCPDLLDQFTDVVPTICGIQKEICSQVRKILINVSGDASSVCPDLVESLQESMHPVFERALGVRGTFLARHHGRSPF